MFVEKPDRYVALMYDGERLIGHAFYLRRPCPWRRTKSITFILQLVLTKSYRGHRLGLKLLQSIFGLSDDAAWGLFTSNPLTIRALEDATFRHISVPTLSRHVRELKAVLWDVFDGTSWLDTFHDGCVDTGFPVQHAANPSKIERAYPNGGFPFRTPLGESEEWLAVVFHSQQIDFDAASLRILTRTSQEVLQDAYSRMDVQNQGWTRHSRTEMEFLLDRGWVKPGDHVLDLGCGMGRHARILAEHGCTVHGVDFASTLIDIARKESDPALPVSFELGDLLTYEPRQKYDVVLCLYDVIGSSIDAEDNERIVDLIRRALKPGGIAAVSVMNLDMVRRICTSSVNRVAKISDAEGFRKLVRLAPSTTMQNSGEVFKGQLMILETETGVVFRKEQFDRQGLMPVEYVIADKRFSCGELESMFAGFKVELLQCVRAGRWSEPIPPTERHAKEVLGVFRKKSSWGLFER